MNVDYASVMKAKTGLLLQELTSHRQWWVKFKT